MKAIWMLLGAVFLGLIATVTIRDIVDRSFVFISFPAIEHSDTLHLANNWKDDSSGERLICVDGQLFFLKFSDTTMKVYRFQNKRTEKVFETSQVSRLSNYIGSSNEYLYYTKHEDREWKNYTLMCCNILSGEEYSIYYGSIAPYDQDAQFSSDGSLYVPLEGSTPVKYIHVFGHELLSDNSPGETFALGDREYAIVPGHYLTLSSTAEDGSTSLVSLPKKDPIQAIIPNQNGLLVYAKGSGNFSLYWIDEFATVVELFSAPCLDSKCVFNTCGTDVYLSFKRYETWGNLGMLRFENDDMEGTWKISLTDFSVKKINDNIFRRMYNFDDTGFYCVDDDWNLFKMDFDGELVPIRVRRKFASQLGSH